MKSAQIRHFGLVAICLVSVLPSICVAQAQADKSPVKPPVKLAPRQKPEDVKPAPPVAIPDNPPPHEGALFDLPITIEPPDMLIVEVLEALPGRPIQGHRLVRPDGTVTLGFYGDVHVRGLTLLEAKEKIILHLRRYLNDEVLGLHVVSPTFLGPEELPGPVLAPGEKVPGTHEKTDHILDPNANAPTKPASLPVGSAPVRIRPTSFEVAQDDAKVVEVTPGKGVKITIDVHPLEGAMEEEEPMMFDGEDPDPIPMVAVAAVESDRVFVDFAAYNGSMYYVEGEVAKEGRFHWTGGDTVMDALFYVGRLNPEADRSNVKLYRPARGGKPAKVYNIDLDAIRTGDKKANLQMFPNDRLVIGLLPAKPIK